MALTFGQGKDEDVTTLIAKKQYAKAIEIIRAQLKTGRPDPRLKLQLADALVLAGKDREAVMILIPLADEFAREGFAAKAISVLKKIQKLDPGRRDIESKLASLIETKQRQAAVAMPMAPGPSSGMPEIGIEEIGFEPPAGGGMSVPAALPGPFGMEEIGVGGPKLPVAAPAQFDFAPAPEPVMAAPAPARASAPAPAAPPTPVFAPATPAPAPRPTPAPRPAPAPVEDHDLLAAEDEAAPLMFDGIPAAPSMDAGPEFSLEPAEPVLEAEPVEAEPVLEAEPVPTTPAVDVAFTSELLSVIDDLFPSGGGVEAAPAADDQPEAGAQIVVSPLFKDFSVDEMVAVIQGLRLISVEPRKVILRQGDRGDSLFMLTSGHVRAFVKDPDGKQNPVADLEEGAFFGEMSVLTGKPRTATVVAVTACELLELDRPTLDGIVAKHPRVREILQEFARERSQHR